MQDTNKIVVAYNGGSYGSYLLWLLWTLTSDNDIVNPFNKENGNSHEFYKYARNDILPLNPNDLLNNISVSKAKFIKVHPKIHATDNVANTMDTLVDKFGQAILIYPSHNTYLLNINNFFSKIWTNLWESLLTYINVNDIYDNYPDAQGLELEQLPIWLVREYLSFNVFSSWESQVDWYLPDYYSNKDVHLVKIEDILYNTKSVLQNIKQMYNLEWTKSIESIMPYHNTNLNLQKNLKQDQICNQILNSIFSDTNFSWSGNDLTLISEAYLQKKLRDSGYDLRCHNLNTFPTTTTQLKEIIL